MIVKDEEDVLPRCLDSARTLADEMILVDTGSSDRTKAVIEAYGGRLFEYEWQGDFAAARNHAFSKATSDYCFWLDADDILPPDTVRALKALKEQADPDVDVIMLPYQTAFDEKGRPTFYCWRERILRRDSRCVFKGRVHEAVAPYGRVVYVDAPVRHHKIAPSDPDRNLKIYEKMIEAGEALDARQLYYYGRELLTHGRLAEGEAVFLRFLRSEEGWIEDRIDATRQLAYCRYGLGKDQEALYALLFGLTLDRARAESCCDIGRHFFDREAYDNAVFWYKAALLCRETAPAGGFIQTDCHGFLPCIQLCRCYDRMGDLKTACMYNEQASRYKPDAEWVVYNRKYFSEKGIG